MKIEIGRKTQIILVLLFLVGIASGLSDFGNNINIPGIYTGNGSGLTYLLLSNTMNTPAGSISATTGQNAINELDTEKLALTGGTMSGNIALNGQNITGGLDISSKNIGGVIYADQYANLQAA